MKTTFTFSNAPEFSHPRVSGEPQPSTTITFPESKLPPDTVKTFKKGNVIKHWSNLYVDNKNCRQCDGKLLLVGDFNPWQYNLQCDKCGSKYLFSPNDMGQSTDDLYLVKNFPKRP